MQNLYGFLILCLLSLVPTILSESTCALKACQKLDSDKINVHLIPHSHNELGWLKTTEEYFYGTHNDIDGSGVRYELDAVLLQLQKSNNRSYVQAETAYFWKWWQLQSEDKRQLFKSFVDNGRIEIVGGGWSINDEACTNYQSIINQFTWGLRILNETLGECGRPKIGWQIDTFGHSREQASIFQQMGYEAIFFSRISESERTSRKYSKILEFKWRTNDNIENSEIFVSIMDSYNGTNGFCWDYTGCSSDAFNDDPESFDYNLDRKIEDFENYIAKYSSYFQTNNILIPVGGNFEYQLALINYVNMDKLIESFKHHKKYKVFYSTPSCYLQAVKSHKIPYYIKESGDFFPYDENSHTYWTGLYTSRPTIKKFARTGNNILQAAHQINSFAKIRNLISSTEAEDNLNSLREAVATMQHHQAITGTHRERVAKDYARVMTNAITETEANIGNILGKLLKKDDVDGDVSLKLSSCLLTNISVCDNSMTNRSLIVLYNPLPKPVFYNLRIPVPSVTFNLTGPDGPVDFELLVAIEYPVNSSYQNSTTELVTTLQLPPMGLNVYYLEKIGERSTPVEAIEVHDTEELVLENQGVKFSLNPKTRKQTITTQSIMGSLDQNYMIYSSSTGEDVDAPSGSYVFRPQNNTAAVVESSNYRVAYLKGKYHMEIIEYIDDFIAQIIRNVVEDDGVDKLEYIEYDWLVGPLNNKTVQTKLKMGSELIVRYSMDDVGNFVFYTDSNGRQMIQRERRTIEEPVAANYYPVTSKISFTDEEHQMQLSVLTDRAQGGSSLNSSEIELMLLRRTLLDDHKGLNEPLQEMEFGNYIMARGKHYITMGSSNGSRFERILALNKLTEPWLLIADARSDDMAYDVLKEKINFEWSGLTVNDGKGLPHNINIMNLEPWKLDTYLLRVEHIFDKDEDEHYSQKTSIELRDIFSPYTITSVEEVNLGANEFIDRTIDGPTYNITLIPMEIRTFIVTFT